MKKKERIIKILRSVVVLVLAVVIAMALIMLKPKPNKQPPRPSSLIVETIKVKRSSPVMIVKSYGTVRPGETLNLVSEVRGKIVEMSSNLKEGGVLKNGELLIRIDPRSYELDVAQKKKQLKQIDVELRRIDQEKKNLRVTLTISRKDVDLAKAEQERFKALVKRKVAAQSSLDQAEQKYLASKSRMQEIENQLALIGPRADQLKVQRELLEVRLKEALLNLDRTRISAPFEGRVLEKKAEKGQFVNTGISLGRIYNSSTLEVEVRIPFRDLPWLNRLHTADYPLKSKPMGFLFGAPIRAKIIFNSSGQPHIWDGSVTRIKAEVDEKTRTLPLIIEIPAESSRTQAYSSYPLTPGMFVNVELIGKKIEHVYLLPRSVIHPGNLVYLANDNKLAVRSVEILRRMDDSVYVSKGLKDGDMVIITPISAPKEGTKLRLRQKQHNRGAQS